MLVTWHKYRALIGQLRSTGLYTDLWLVNWSKSSDTNTECPCSGDAGILNSRHWRASRHRPRDHSLVQHGWVKKEGIQIRRHYEHIHFLGEYVKDTDFLLLPQDPLLDNKFPRPLVSRRLCEACWQAKSQCSVIQTEAVTIAKVTHMTHKPQITQSSLLRWREVTASASGRRWMTAVGQRMGMWGEAEINKTKYLEAPTGVNLIALWILSIYSVRAL